MRSIPTIAAIVLFSATSMAQTVPAEIARGCAAKWGADYEMQLYCRNKQTDALRKLAAQDAVQAPAPNAEQGNDYFTAGWWVVYGSVKQGVNDPRVFNAMQKKLRPCGIEPFNDFSFKFSGFATGLEVYVSGAYPSKSEAALVLKGVKRCAPDAYIKQARYAGE